MSVRIEVRPSVLEWARARSGDAREDWERCYPRFEAWQSGDTALTLKQLEEFARKTCTPVGFLFLDAPLVEPVPIPDFRTVGDRPVGAGEVVSADFLDVVYICQAHREWYRGYLLLIKIPRACVAHGVQWCRPFHMLRVERARFVLEGVA